MAESLKSERIGKTTLTGLWHLVFGGGCAVSEMAALFLRLYGIPRVTDENII